MNFLTLTFLSFLEHCKILKTYLTLMYIDDFFYYFRFIVLRRLCLLLGLLYGYRAITMFVTVLPISNPNYQCDPKLTVSGQAKKTRETKYKSISRKIFFLNSLYNNLKFAIRNHKKVPMKVINFILRVFWLT